MKNENKVTLEPSVTGYLHGNEKALPPAITICSPRAAEGQRKESPSRLCGRLALPLFRDPHQGK